MPKINCIFFLILSLFSLQFFFFTPKSYADSLNSDDLKLNLKNILKTAPENEDILHKNLHLFFLPLASVKSGDDYFTEQLSNYLTLLFELKTQAKSHSTLKSSYPSLENELLKMFFSNLVQNIYPPVNTTSYSLRTAILNKLSSNSCPSFTTTSSEPIFSGENKNRCFEIQASHYFKKDNKEEIFFKETMSSIKLSERFFHEIYHSIDVFSENITRQTNEIERIIPLKSFLNPDTLILMEYFFKENFIKEIKWKWYVELTPAVQPPITSYTWRNLFNNSELIERDSHIEKILEYSSYGDSQELKKRNFTFFIFWCYLKTLKIYLSELRAILASNTLINYIFDVGTPTGIAELLESINVNYFNPNCFDYYPDSMQYNFFVLFSPIIYERLKKSPLYNDNKWPSFININRFLQY